MILEKTQNYLKSLTAETISNAKSGHTGSALGASTMMLALFHDHLKFYPKDPAFLGRDRLVMSAGHTSGLYYSLLHLFGYDISMDDLKNFRKYGSKTPGHPEYRVVPGVETTTGPLGQGIANAVGLALAETIFAENFNDKSSTLFDNYTYCYTGDGCLMEGVGMEACSIAGTLGLNKLILLYDNNDITIDGKRELANQEDTAKKFEAMNWNVIEVKNGMDYDACSKAIAKAKNSKKPTIIIFKTIIGVGTKVQGTNKVHAYPLPPEELEEFKKSLGVESSFFVPEDVYAFCRESVTKNKKFYDEYTTMLSLLKSTAPEKLKKLKSWLSSSKVNYEKILKDLEKQPELAGRDISHIVLNKIAEAIPSLVGGTADVSPSTKAFIENGGDYSSSNRLGKNIHYGIREHAMGSISNGISLYALTPVFDSTFMAFSNYMLPSIKMRAMMNLPIISIFTHDSIDIGEDGPTHQPIEQIGSLRQIVGLKVFRPATKAETVAGFKFMLESKSPTVMSMTKSKLKDLENSNLENAMLGGYVIFESGKNPEIEILASGTEVALAVSVAKALPIPARVISMPCEKLFSEQPSSYKNKVLLPNAKLKVAIEATDDPIWYKYIGTDGLLVNVEKYQCSGKGSEVYFKAGFNEECIIKQICKKLKI